MSLDWKKINECRQGYIDKRNADNEDIALANGLNEEQISAIETICRLSHEIHSLSVTVLLMPEAQDYDLIDRNLVEINELIAPTGLPPLGINENTYEAQWVLDMDWTDGYAKEKYYLKAEHEVANGYELDKPGHENNRFYPVYSIDDLARRLFEEDAADVNAEIQEKINSTIEKWLAAIDEKYGTKYCPAGGQRLL